MYYKCSIINALCKTNKQKTTFLAARELVFG